MLESLFGVVGLVPAVGPWIRDKWFVMTGRQMKVECRPDTSFFLRDREHYTGLVVLHIVVQNQVSSELWIKDLRLDAHIDQAWTSCERWPGKTYAASWGLGWKICNSEERIDTRIDEHLSIEAKSSTAGYTVHRIGVVIPDSASLTCRVTLIASEGKPVVTTLEVTRHVNERQRVDVKILQDIDVGLNGLRFHYDESRAETITIPRFVYETIVNSTQEQNVQLVNQWELADE
jgi:hypothetical protein